MSYSLSMSAASAMGSYSSLSRRYMRSSRRCLSFDASLAAGLLARKAATLALICGSEFGGAMCGSEDGDVTCGSEDGDVMSGFEVGAALSSLALFFSVSFARREEPTPSNSGIGLLRTSSHPSRKIPASGCVKTRVSSLWM